jgi:hypothetical protein
MKSTPSPSPSDSSFRLHRGHVSDLDSEVHDMVERIDGPDGEMRDTADAWDDEADFGPARRSRWKWVAVAVILAALIACAALAASGQDPVALIRSVFPSNAPDT